MISERLLTLVRCPDCRGHVERKPGAAGRFACASCRREFRGDSYLDMRPVAAFAEQTKYLDGSLHADARHERVSPPLLGSRIRNDMLRRFLAPGPDDLVIDLGCGSGRALLWNRDLGAAAIGIDISPYFSEDARGSVDLLLGDLRRLPFADGTFTKAWSLDVLEHLSPEALRAMLGEVSRVLKPGGALFVYTHVRENARIAAGLRVINALAARLEQAGLIDLRQEHLRKSDHVNPLRDIPELEAVAAGAGFRIGRIRYYTPLVGGFVENILVRMAERALAKRAARRMGGSVPAPQAEAAAVREARQAAKAHIARSPSTYAALRALSTVMKLDLLLFGRVRSGPFFALLIKE